MADALASFGFWLIGGGLSVVLSIFSALALPVWDFAWLHSANFSALQPVINAAAWAFDFNTINTAFGVVVASLTAYTVAVFYWRVIGGQFMSVSGVAGLAKELGGSGLFGVIKQLVFDFLGLPTV